MGDAPLLPPALLQRVIAEQRGAAARRSRSSAPGWPTPPATAGSFAGRTAAVAAIVEEADADEATRRHRRGQRRHVRLRRCRGCARRSAASPRRASGELYLTDLVALAADEGCPASVVVADDAADAIGINDRVALADAERRMQRRIAEEHMRNGVTIVDPETTRIDAGVEIGQDARIEPWTVLAGSTVIGQDAVIGPHAHVRDSRIGPRTTVWASALEESTVAEDVEIGPYAHLRPGSEVGPRCRIGNFAEIKNSRIGAGTQQHHFSYLGDAEIGENVNVGAGSVTANFDGRDEASRP